MKGKYKVYKKNLYFKIPVLPKKGDLEAKADMLSTPELEQNIMHEMVRRKRWNYVHKGINCKGGSDMFMKPDCAGQTPMMYSLEKAPFDVAMSITMMFLSDEPTD